MIKSLLERSKSYLDSFYAEIDVSSWENALDICLKSKGQILFMGLGKSGFIAKKIAMTLVSCGIKASYLDPLNVLHGDLGIVDSGDVVFVMSKSGFTKELVELVPYIKKRGAQVIACVSSKGSPLEIEADHSVYLPVASELDVNNLVPTTSTQVQLIFGDVITSALMVSRGIGLDLYATLHPAGAIGKKLLTKVEELMLPQDQVPLCNPEKTIKDVLVELTSKKCGCVVITDKDNSLKGIFTDGDLRRSLQTLGVDALDMPVSELMNHHPISIAKIHSAFEAKKAMQQEAKGWINVLPVVDDRKVVGLLRLHDILKAGI